MTAKGLGRPVFQTAQALYCIVPEGIAAEMIASDAFDCHDTS